MRQDRNAMPDNAQMAAAVMLAAVGGDVPIGIPKKAAIIIQKTSCCGEIFLRMFAIAGAFIASRLPSPIKMPLPSIAFDARTF